MDITFAPFHPAIKVELWATTERNITGFWMFLGPTLHPPNCPGKP